MTRSEFKIEAMMQECRIGRQTAIEYLESTYWHYHDAVDPTIAMGLTPEYQYLLK